MPIINALYTKIKTLLKLKKLNKNFENISDWLFDNNLSIHFDEDKIKELSNSFHK